VVSKPSAQYIEPASVCDVCGRQFVAGDQAILVVKVPEGDFDTMCPEDYITIISSASAWLKSKGNTRPDLIRSLVDEARGIVEAEIDRMAREDAQA
jgi:hypothetical protein